MVIETRNITKQDIMDIVDIHKEAFSDFFLSSLGKPFLKLYYRSLIELKDGVAICAIDAESNILGFCVGTTNSAGFHKRMIISNIFQFSTIAVKLLITNPRSIFRLISNLEKQPIKQSTGTVAELLSIGVRKSAKGIGVGSKLIQQFENELTIRKSAIVTLTTDFYDNEKVIGFYQNIGYKIYCDFISHPNRKMYKMIKYL